MATTPTSLRPSEADVGAMFDAHSGFLLRVVERLAGSGPHVEDIVQEVFLTAHRRRSQVPAEPHTRGWLYRCAANLAKHHRRSFVRRTSFVERFARGQSEALAPGPDVTLANRQEAEAIRRCVAGLPSKHRDVFVLYELEELEGGAVAKLLSIPENTVWTRLHHARRRFRALWEKQRRRDGAFR